MKRASFILFLLLALKVFTFGLFGSHVPLANACTEIHARTFASANLSIPADHFVPLQISYLALDTGDGYVKELSDVLKLIDSACREYNVHLAFWFSGKSPVLGQEYRTHYVSVPSEFASRFISDLQYKLVRYADRFHIQIAVLPDTIAIQTKVLNGFKTEKIKFRIPIWSFVDPRMSRSLKKPFSCNGKEAFEGLSQSSLISARDREIARRLSASNALWGYTLDISPPGSSHFHVIKLCGV